MAVPKRYYGIGLSVLLGIGARVAYIFMMPDVVDPFLPAIITCALIYLVFGIAAGFIWRDGDWQRGLWVAAPFLVIVGLSMSLAGIYTPKIFTKDIPIIVTTVVTACLGAFLGSRVLSLANR